jgi:hypothetical protein
MDAVMVGDAGGMIVTVGCLVTGKSEVDTAGNDELTSKRCLDRLPGKSGHRGRSCQMAGRGCAGRTDTTGTEDPTAGGEFGAL